MLFKNGLTAAAAVLRGIALIAMLIASDGVLAQQPWFIGEHGTIGSIGIGLHGCPSYEDWVRFEVLRYRENDVEAAIKFLDQQCPTTIPNGNVVVEEIAKPPSDIPLDFALCLRPVADPRSCLWLDSCMGEQKMMPIGSRAAI